MKKVFGQYRGWTLLIIPKWNGQKTTFFIIGPGPDPRVMFGERDSHDDAIKAGRKAVIYEARNEPSSRSDR